MSKIDNDDLVWFTEEFNARISANRTMVAKIDPTGWQLGRPDDSPIVLTEQGYEITLGESDLNTLVHILKTASKHEELQKRSPLIREAWMNYMTMVLLTSDEYNWKYHSS